MASKWHSLGDFIVLPGESNVSSARVIPRFLTNFQFYLAILGISTTIAICASFGLVTNTINTRTFLQMDLRKTPYNIWFLCLSLTDLIFCFFNIIWGFCQTMFALEVYKGPMFKFDPLIIHLYAANFSQIFYTNSILTTMFIALVRCLCVLHPLRFQHFLTVERSLLAIVFSTAFAFATKLPTTATASVRTKFSLDVNGTRYMLTYSSNREEVRDITNMITHTIVPVTTQTVLFICVLVMARGLKRAAEFRKTISVQANGGDIGKRLRPKDIQVIRQVLLLSFVFLVCNSPKLLVGAADALVPEMNESQVSNRYSRLLKLLNPFRRIFEVINCSVNIFIYYKYNSKYRSLFGNKQVGEDKGMDDTA